MAGKITTNSVVLGDSVTDTQNFVLKTNADGTATLARGALGGLGTVLTVDASSNVTLQKNISVGGATPTTSGTGITFPATQSASADANTLDDYEEGTFTPNVFYSGTNTPSYNGQVGRYTKIGRIVQIQMYLGWNENGSTGNLTFTGLPFTSVSINPRAIPTFFSFGLLAVTSSITGYVLLNSTSIEPFINDNAATAVTATNTDNDQDVYMTVTYEVA